MSAGDPETPADALWRLAGALGRYGIDDFAVTGGVAVGVWSTPRQTRDLDICAVVPPDAVNALLARYDGIRAGTGDVPDIMRLRIGDWDVDVFVATDEYDASCLRRAVETKIGHATVRVVSAEDLLIHKMIKLRSDRRRLLQDAADIRAVVEARSADLDHTYLRRWLPRQEAEIIARSPGLSDEELIRGLAALGG